MPACYACANQARPRAAACSPWHVPGVPGSVASPALSTRSSLNKACSGRWPIRQPSLGGLQPAIVDGSAACAHHTSSQLAYNARQPSARSRSHRSERCVPEIWRAGRLFETPSFEWLDAHEERSTVFYIRPGPGPVPCARFRVCGAHSLAVLIQANRSGDAHGCGGASAACSRSRQTRSAPTRSWRWSTSWPLPATARRLLLLGNSAYSRSASSDVLLTVRWTDRGTLLPVALVLVPITFSGAKLNFGHASVPVRVSESESPAAAASTLERGGTDGWLAESSRRWWQGGGSGLC